jgi:group I intron endonuclease|tara:strand:+ start:74 stop:697 length:624 start_codon:yes stop_codon:yes gene_type:complete
MANSNKVKKHHFIYKTTNLLNDKYYVGMHSTNNLKDGYMGSGKRLRYSIRKYGVENFKLEILEWFDSREALVERETQLVNVDLIKDEMCLNLKPGGQGGFVNDEHAKKFHSAGGKAVLQMFGKLHQQKMKTDLEYRENVCMKLRGRNTFGGKSHSDESKKKMSESSKGKGVGSSNSQFGTCWITNGNESKKIYKGDIIPKEWHLGRK